jgi:uncharacterized protein (DUF1499 family)
MAMVATRSRLARVGLWLGLLSLLTLAAGPVLAHLAWVRPFSGFRIFLLGLLLGVVVLLLGALALFATRSGAARADRARAWSAFSCGAVASLLLIGLAGGGRGLPLINDITTSPDDPPPYQTAPTLPENRGRDFVYPAGNAALERAAYPDLAPLELALPPAEAFARALRAAQALGWQVTRSDPEAGALEATSTSRIFRFVDDVVVRVRADGAGARIDVRSKSRDGTGDLGANAARIRAFRARLSAG